MLWLQGVFLQPLYVRVTEEHSDVYGSANA